MIKISNLMRAALIGAVALTGLTTAPARAGDNDALAAFLLGAGVLAVIAHEGRKSNETPHRYRPRVTDVPYDGPDRPGKACLRKRWTEKGWVVYRNQKCVANLRSAPPAVARKPKECLRQRWTDNGWEKFWSKACLTRKGYAG